MSQDICWICNRIYHKKFHYHLSPACIEPAASPTETSDGCLSAAQDAVAGGAAREPSQGSARDGQGVGRGRASRSGGRRDARVSRCKNTKRQDGDGVYVSKQNPVHRSFISQLCRMHTARQQSFVSDSDPELRL